MFKEQTRAVGNLNPAEKVLFSVSSIVLGNRYMRNLFVIYALGLHILIFSMAFDSSVGSIMVAWHLTNLFSPSSSATTPSNFQSVPPPRPN